MSTMSSLSKLWDEFYYDVAKATFQLLVLLRGAELTLNSVLLDRQHDSPGIRSLFPSIASPSYLDSYPMIHGTDVMVLLQQKGGVEQLAYKAWVVEVAGIWEHNYRGRLKRAIEAEGMSYAIQPELNVLGDFQHIRNDLVHNKGVAKTAAMDKCEELKWFCEDEPITLGIFLVLDFLHRLGCLHRSIRVVELEPGFRGYLWEFASIENLRSRNPTPRIVSFRTGLEANPESGEIWHLVSLVFSNGFFSQHAGSTGLSDTEENWEDLREILRSVRITEEGDLDSEAPWMKAKAQEIYDLAVHDLYTPNAEREERSFPKGGFPGPWIKFRNPPNA